MSAEDSYKIAIIKELERSSEDPEILLKAGSYFFEPGRDPHKAVELLSKALRIDPRNTRVYFWLAKCLYHDFCNYAEAERLIRDSLEIDPRQPDALILLASVMGDLDRPLADRVKVLRRALELAPDWPLPREFLVQLLLEEGRTSEVKALLTDWDSTGGSYHPVVVTNPTEEYYEEAVTGRNNAQCYVSLRTALHNIKALGGSKN